jgi:LuxR family quorum sensing-dependent transcriptional regulator
MSYLEDVALSFLDRCRQHAALAELIADFVRTLSNLGFNFFIMTRLPAVNEDPEPLIIAHTWPDEWGNRYRAERYFWADPVTRFSFESFRPFTWGEARRGSPRTRISRRLAHEARELGLVDGVGFPIGDSKAAQGVVSLSADQRVDLPPRIMALVEIVVINCERRALELIERPFREIPPLTPREREILQWIAAGKTQTEVGEILEVSHHTVEQHMYNIRSKTDSITNTQAIAKALFGRLIHL